MPQKMDEPGTVFCLFPKNKAAEDIVRDDANWERMRQDPDNPSKRFLRIGFDLQSKTPGYLVKFGRHHSNDVILGKGWSKIDQCYFDFHPITGELLLHDVSSRENTRLRDKDMTEQIRKRPRRCVVLLGREWDFVVGRAEFRLKPQETQDLEAFTGERLSFVRQPVPEDYEGTYEGTLEQLLAFDLQSVRSSAYNTRMNTPFQPEPGDEIRYTKVKRLGEGSQGNVYEVVDMHTGDHYACKVIQPKPIPEWGIYTEKAFRLKIEAEVVLLKKLRHDHILEYVCSQGWSTGHDINIFQPVCQDGSLDKMITNFKSQEERQTTATTMFCQISLALDYIHTQNPPIIHRDIKPGNILCQSGKFLLADFGIAKTVNNSHTLVGTDSYMAPEIWEGGDQTIKVDIYGVGATIIECLDGFPAQEERPATRQLWHHHLQTRATGRPIAPMLATSASERPTAHEIIRNFFRDSLYPFVQSPRSFRRSSFVSPPIPGLVNGTAKIHSLVPTLMEWTRTVSAGPSQNAPQKDSTQPTSVTAQYTLPRNRLSGQQRHSKITRASADISSERRRKSQKRNTPSRSEHGVRPESAEIPRTSLSRKRRLRSESILVK